MKKKGKKLVAGWVTGWVFVYSLIFQALHQCAHDEVRLEVVVICFNHFRNSF